MALPTFRSLMAFEASARLGSFSRAAEELHVTQAAISQQIRLLEEQIGGLLFKREARRITLTELGSTYIALAHGPLQTLATSFESVRSMARPDVLVIKSTSSFIEAWLLPRLPRFLASMPTLSISIATYDLFDSLATSVGDVVISSGKAGLPEFQESLLIPIGLVPVAAPSYIDMVGQIALSGRQRYRIIHTTTRRDDWGLWCRAVGLPAFPVDRGMMLANSSLSGAAAENGMGVLIAEDVLIADRLASKAVVAVHPSKVVIERAYYLLEPVDRPRKIAAVAFVDWLRGEIRDVTQLHLRVD